MTSEDNVENSDQGNNVCYDQIYDSLQREAIGDRAYALEELPKFKGNKAGQGAIRSRFNSAVSVTNRNLEAIAKLYGVEAKRIDVQELPR